MNLWCDIKECGKVITGLKWQYRCYRKAGTTLRTSQKFNYALFTKQDSEPIIARLQSEEEFKNIFLQVVERNS